MYYIYQTVKTFLILHKIYNIFNEMFQIPLNFVHQRILKKKMRIPQKFQALYPF